MGSLLFHPAVVHIPIGVALLAPILALVALAALAKGRSDRHLWGVVVLVQIIVVAGALVAQRTGRAEEDRVEEVVSEAVIEVHEERAETFTVLAAAGFATAAAVLVAPAGPALAAAAVVATAASAVEAGAALWVGHSGGELVYRHGAASVYAKRDPSAAREKDDEAPRSGDRHTR